MDYDEYTIDETCPYCNHSYDVNCMIVDWDDDQAEIVCEQCGEKFIIDRRVTYRFYRSDAL